MNVTEETARLLVCCSLGRQCQGSDCMAWQWDEPLMLNPPADSYIAEPGPTGHCGLTEGTHA